MSFYSLTTSINRNGFVLSSARPSRTIKFAWQVFSREQRWNSWDTQQNKVYSTMEEIKIKSGRT